MTKKDTDKGLIQRVADTHRLGMAKVLRNVANQDWGWFSREDERMHLQTISRGKDPVAKVWLEDRGKHICEPALTGAKIEKGDLAKVRAAVKANRELLDTRWIQFMILNEWLRVDIKGHILTLTAYPKSHNKYTREIDLMKEYPGGYTHGTWATRKLYTRLDEDSAMFIVGPYEDDDDNYRQPLAQWVFKD